MADQSSVCPCKSPEDYSGPAMVLNDACQPNRSNQGACIELESTSPSPHP